MCLRFLVEEVAEEGAFAHAGQSANEVERLFLCVVQQNFFTVGTGIWVHLCFSNFKGDSGFDAARD